MADFDLFFVLLNGLGLMALIALAFGTLERLVPDHSLRPWLHGSVFALGTIAAMLSAAPLADGIIIDVRCVIVALAGAFVGWPAALLAGLAGVLFRIWLGGVGAPIGVTTVVFAAGVGLVWGWLYRSGQTAKRRHLMLLGLVVSAHVALFIFLPVPDPLTLTARVIPYVVPTYLAGVFVMGSMMQREARMIRREQSLEVDAFTDSLTGLANRRAYDALVADELAKARHGPVGAALLVVDFDYFKQINDTYGHEIGDEALKAVGKIMRSCVRHGDYVCRHGGEEFAVILPQTGIPQARRAAERIRHAIETAPLTARDRRLSLTVSIGVAATPQHADDADTLYRCADAALYEAKSEGRDRVVVYGRRQSGLSVLALELASPIKAESLAIAG
ncbi:diguanylate cyclase [Aurantimonas sp. A2-1-M11]|uniref:GGDEF domain-containing protein n=1 Tax=Aurantimonas sp. A2-1-M11 TaxID=3113712 RepID=UPI002F948D02